ncbi:MAG: hypothetical protein V9F02_09110 [Chitinophagaceae bacterium]
MKEDGMTDEEIDAMIKHEASWRVPNLFDKALFWRNCWLYGHRQNNANYRTNDKKRTHNIGFAKAGHLY